MMGVTHIGEKGSLMSSFCDGLFLYPFRVTVKLSVDNLPIVLKLPSVPSKVVSFQRRLGKK